MKRSEFVEFLQHGVDMARQLADHVAHAQSTVRVPSDDDEARALCEEVFAAPTRTTTEIALARYLLHRMGPSDLKDRSAPSPAETHDRRQSTSLRLSGRTIERAVLLPLTPQDMLPMLVLLNFADGGVLSVTAQSAITLTEVGGTTVTFPARFSSQDIDDVIAGGVTPR